MKFFESKKYGRELYDSIMLPVCEKHNITHMEYTILMILSLHEEINTAAKIVKTEFLTKSHVSMSIKSLYDKNLIVGEHLGEDKKTIYLRLCDNAKPIVNDGKEAYKKFTEILTAGLTEDDVNKICEILNKIDQNVINYLDKERK